MSASPPLRQLRGAQALEARTQAIGRELFRLTREHHAHLTSLNRWAKQVLAWCLNDPQLKGRILRLIDVLPSLHSPLEIVRHLREYFPNGQTPLPPALQVGVSLSRGGLLTAPAMALVVHQLVEQVARQFIAGATIQEAIATVQRLATQGALVSFDVLGEQVTSDFEADRYTQRYEALIEELGRWHRTRSPASVAGRSGAIQVSIKPSALSAHFDPWSFDQSVQQALARLIPIAQLAVRVGASITLDMEQYASRDLTLELATRLLESQDDTLELGIVIQAYLHDSELVVAEWLEWLSAHRRRVSVRLVKGAYWDSEVAQARQHEWEIPVYLEKWQTDAAFERLTHQLLSSHPTVRTAIASHNLRSIAHAMAVAETLGLAHDQLEFQLLYGMGDAIQGALVQLGYPVRVYTPFGALIPGMAYLVRRILENTANESFLRQDLWDGASMDELLAPPRPSSSSGAARTAGVASHA